MVGGLRSGCYLLDFVDSLFGVGICSIRRMVVESLMDGVEASRTEQVGKEELV